jgi:hypothetical protein
MHIDLRSIKVGVAQPFLELKGGDAFFSLGHGKAMAECMGTGVPDDPCLVYIFPNQFSDSAFTQGLALVVEEKMVFKSLGSYGKVSLDGL